LERRCALTRWAQRSPVVLSCLSGRRSEEFLTQLPPSSHPMATLEGGLLAWRALDLPVSGLKLARQAPQAPPPDGIFAHLRACFVAQLTETSLDQDAAQLDPMTLLTQCFERADCDSPPHDALTMGARLGSRRGALSAERHLLGDHRRQPR